MSFTGFKSILLFSYLLQKPRTYDEIKYLFETHEYLRETISLDTLRVYLNSLQNLGCIIKHVKRDNDFEYVLESHPFELKITNEQAKSIITALKSVMRIIEIDDLIPLTNFLDKLTPTIEDEKLRETFAKLSPISKLNKHILQTLLTACQKGETITILYKSPSKTIKEIDVLAKRMFISHRRLYLQGLSDKYKNVTNFLVSRILDIPVIKLNPKAFDEIEPVKVVCEIYDKKFEPIDNEKIVSENENFYTLEITSTNLFYTKQRILSLGSDCKVLSPLSFQQDIISTLKKMKEEYLEQEF